MSQDAIHDVIILIGPINAGKSTQARLVSEALDAPRRSMDEVRWDYYNEIGYDKERANELQEEGGFLALYEYWKPFEAHAVERLLQDIRDCVIDFGGGHSVYEDDALFDRAKAAMEPYANVVLILPSPDLDESVAILRERSGDTEPKTFCFHEHFVKHPSNRALAKQVVYTKDKSPEETRDDILRAVDWRPSSV